VHPHVDALLVKARQVPADQVEQTLQKEHIALDAPVVLLCENGENSAAVADRLEAIGYDQVYVVAGGVDGLLSEL
jgi:rhodanese-related sulfurtransferase